MFRPEPPAPPGPPPMASDEDIVAAVRRGELTRFELLMRRYNQRVYRVARALLKDNRDAEEVVQQAWLAAWEHLPDFRGTARFSTWLVRIVINESLMRARGAGRALSLDEPDALEPSMPALNPEETAELRELARLVERAVDALPDTYRVVFVLREVEGVSTADAAESLQVSEEVVKTRLHRARAMLRDDLMAKVGQSAPEVFTFGQERCDRTVGAVMRAVQPKA